MDRMTTAQKVGAGGALLLLVSSFLPWYSADLGAFGSVNFNAWDANFFAWGGVILGVAGGVILALKGMGTKDVKAGGFAAEQIALLLGAASLVLILLRLLTEMTGVSYGLFLGIIGAALVAYGSFTAMKAAGMSVDDMKQRFGGTDQPGGPPPTPPAP
jgi:hypothetical protein